MKLSTLSRFSLLAFLFFGFATVSHARVLFQDGFEPSRTDSASGGFQWRGHGRNVYTTEDPITGKRTVPFRGARSLAFTHRAKPDGKDSTAEQRFTVGGTFPNLWIRYLVRIPDNYAHRPQSSGVNNKWLCLWSDEYGSMSSGITVCWSTLPSESAAGGSDIVYSWTHAGIDGKRKQSPFRGRTQFITRGMRGKWVEMVHHVRFPRTRTSDDAVVQAWMRPVGQERYISLQNDRDLPLRFTRGPMGFTAGYLMGWSNSGYDHDTTFYMDEFQMSDTPPDSL